ncbi:MAG: 3-dehydroquinate dehydratase [Candidatus Cloacimonetes bacterium]|nr:3-dehydroquinate dehydratase [Candidatus Cloacimonadota bacterium]
MNVHVINGPNLDRLGKREPEVYGLESLEQLQAWLERQCPADQLTFVQSSHEGALIDALFAAEDENADGVVLNAAGYTHTSIALRDAVKTVNTPVIEVHLSNIHAREEFRRRTLTGETAKGVISGLGKFGYLAAIEFLRRGE